MYAPAPATFDLSVKIVEYWNIKNNTKKVKQTESCQSVQRLSQLRYPRHSRPRTQTDGILPLVFQNLVKWMKLMHLARFMWMQQLQTVYETEIQRPKDELWVFRSLGSTGTLRFFPKYFFLRTLPFLWTLPMPKRLTWSFAEIDSSLHIYKKISNRQMLFNRKSNTLSKIQ